MSPDEHHAPNAHPVTTVLVGHHSRVIVLCGAIKDDAVEQLRDQLMAAIEAGVRELFLDLSEVESIVSPVHDLVAAASNMLADRGGVLLAWRRKFGVGHAAYVLADLRDRALGEFVSQAGRE